MRILYNDIAALITFVHVKCVSYLQVLFVKAVYGKMGAGHELPPSPPLPLHSTCPHCPTFPQLTKVHKSCIQNNSLNRTKK